MVARAVGVVAAAAVGTGLSHSSVAFVSFGVLLKPLSEQFAWDRAQITGAISLATLIVAFGTPAIGRLVDRVGARRVLLPSMLAWAALYACLALLTGSLLQFYLLFALTAVAGLGSNSVIYVRVITGWFDRRRGLALGLAMAGVGLAAVAIPRLTVLLIEQAGWQAAYLGFAAIVLAAIPLIAFPLRDSPTAEHAANGTAAPQFGVDVATALRTRLFWTLGASFFLAATAIHGCTVHLMALFTDRGLTPAAAASAMAVFGVGILLGRVSAGWLMDRLFAPRVAVVFFLGPLVALAALGAGVPAALAPLIALLIGLGTGAEIDVIAYLTGRYFGLRHFAEIYGYFYAAFMVGVSVGPLLVALGFEATESYRAPLVVAALVVAAPCALLLSLGPYPAPNAESDPGARP